MLVIPLQMEHEAALSAFLADFELAGESSIPAYFGRPEWNHEQKMEKVSAWAKGEQ